MVRDVKFIWQSMSYRDLKAVLKENRRIRVFPLVEKPGKYYCPYFVLFIFIILEFL